VFFRILFIAILNLMLGYILAWYLHGPRGIFDWPKLNWLDRLWRRSVRCVDDDEELSPSAAGNIPVSSATTDDRSKLAPIAGPNLPQPSVALEAIPAAVPAPANLVSNNANLLPSPEGASARGAAVLADILTEKILAEKILAAGPGSTSPAPAASTEDLDYSLITQAVTNLRDELTQYRMDIAALDTRLRDCVVAPDDDAVRACAENFRRVNVAYLESRGPRLQQIEGAAAPGIVRDVTCELAEAVNRQSAVIKSAQTELAQLGPELELLAQCQQMMDETRQIAVTSSQLDSTIDQTLSEIRRTKPATEPAGINQSTLGQLQNHSLNLEKFSYDARG
jgi:hypothetical protein